MAKKAKKAAKKRSTKKTPKTQYWTNIYEANGQVVVQGNTFITKEAAESNMYQHWPLLETRVVFER